MKQFTLILTVLISFATATFAQIPNSGFESWTNHGTYMEAVGWPSGNSFSAGSYYPVTRSTDHYPAAVGSYSVRMENNPALLPSFEAFGFIWTVPLTDFLPEPSFPVTGHPTSLTGYYKWAPQNGDTMYIQLKLYNGGTEVTSDIFATKIAASSWTPFTLPITSYTTADSGFIIISSFYSDGPYNIPYGNSVLYVDNLNFDNLITSVSEQETQGDLADFYPNPASDMLSLNIENAEINIYDMMGDLVKSETMGSGQRELCISDLCNGVYVCTIRSGNNVISKKLVIQR